MVMGNVMLKTLIESTKNVQDGKWMTNLAG